MKSIEICAATGRSGLAALAAAILGAVSAHAAQKADFLGGVWATQEGCIALGKLSAGGPRNIETVPETLDANGYASWEGGCSFEEITASVPGRSWRVKTSCSEAGEEWSDLELFELDAGGKTLKVTVDGKSTDFVRCDGGKGH